MTDTTDTITQMREHCDKAKERLEVCGLGSFQGLKCKSKMHIYFIVWPHVSINEKNEAEKAAESQRDNRRNVAKVSLREK